MSSTYDKYAIGIDLGTTYCSVAVFKNGTVKVVEDGQGNRRIPSYVAFTDDEYLVGFSAKSQVAMNPSNTVYGVKRLLGRKFDDPQLESDIKYWPFTIIGEEGRPKIQVQYKNETNIFCPEQITALILTALKEIAESYIGKSEVSDVVISVPANFNNLQRKATMDAAQIAGLNVLQLINESTAAAIAYCTNRKITGKRNLLVFDLGGGSFDVSMVSIHGGKLEVKAVSGETHLGGEDFVNNMLSHVAIRFQQNKNIDINSKRFMARLKEACDVAVKELSKVPETRIAVEGCDHSHNVNKEIFNAYNDKLYKKIMMHVDKVLQDSAVGTDNFGILLVGGCTRITKVEELLKTTFSGVQIFKDIDRHDAVAYGAAVQAALLHGYNLDAPKKIVELQDMQHMDVNSNQNYLSKEDIQTMKGIARGLKNDCNIYKERMRCRNNLEEYVIKVQAKFRNLDNNEITGKCKEILDWMSDNEKAAREEYRSQHKHLKALQENLSLTTRATSSLSATATLDEQYTENSRNKYSSEKHDSRYNERSTRFYSTEEDNNSRPKDKAYKHAANKQHEKGNAPTHKMKDSCSIS